MIKTLFFSFLMFLYFWTLRLQFLHFYFWSDKIKTLVGESLKELGVTRILVDQKQSHRKHKRLQDNFRCRNLSETILNASDRSYISEISLIDTMPSAYVYRFSTIISVNTTNTTKEPLFSPSQCKEIWDNVTYTWPMIRFI